MTFYIQKVKGQLQFIFTEIMMSGRMMPSWIKSTSQTDPQNAPAPARRFAHYVVLSGLRHHK